MIEKGFRLVACPTCHKKLKLNNITEANYGTKVRVTCPPPCGNKFRTKIPDPRKAVVEKSPANFLDELVKTLEGFTRKYF